MMGLCSVLDLFKENSFSSSEKANVQKQISTEKVVVYSKSFCPHCIATKKLLLSHGVDATYVSVNQVNKDGRKIQSILFELTKQRTVPNIFIAGQHVGGNSDLHRLAKSGDLKARLDGAGVSNSF